MLQHGIRHQISLTGFAPQSHGALRLVIKIKPDFHLITIAGDRRLTKARPVIRLKRGRPEITRVGLAFTEQAYYHICP